MSTNTKTSARPAPRKRASTKSSKDRPYIQRRKVRERLEARIKELESPNIILPEKGGLFATKFAANVLRGLLHDLEAL